MNKDLTEIVFLLDRSGSMAGKEKDTIGGYNSFLQKMKDQPGRAFVSTVLFDHESKVIHDRMDIQKVQALTEKDYSVRGSTALLDALGSSIHHIAMVHRYARKDDVPVHTVIVITTDGMENASCHYTYTDVKKMIEHQKKKHGWEFLFLGADIDAVKEAEKFGIEEDRSVTFTNDEEGIYLNYAVLSDTVGAIRSGKKVSSHWKDRIEADHRTRKQKGGR